MFARSKFHSWLLTGPIRLGLLSALAVGVSSQAVAMTAPTPTPTPTPTSTPETFFTAYNDLAWKTGQLNTNITMITSPDGGSSLPSSDQLIDFQSGTPTGVSLTVAGGEFTGDSQAAQGADAVVGTDAFDAFDGRVSTQGTISYVDAAGSPLVLTFQGLSPTRYYELVFHAHRNDYG